MKVSSAKPSVVVVGAGVIGLSCAWRLAEAGCSVRLFDQAQPGAGATGASLGALIPASVLRDAPVSRLQRESLGLFAAYCEDIERASGATHLYERCHRLELFTSEGRRVEAQREQERALGRLPWFEGQDESSGTFVQQVLTAEEAARVVPGVRAELGGLYCRASAQVDPARLVAALRVACEKAGVAVETDARVERLHTEHDQVRGVVQAGRVIPADRVVAATGVPLAGLDPLVEACAPVEPAKGQAILLRCVAAAPTCVVRRKSIYVMNRGPEHVVVGSTTEHAAGFDDRVTPEAVEKLRHGAAQFLPELTDATLVRSWAGLRPSSVDLHPYLGPVPGVPNLLVARGHYKIGIALAPITAEILTDFVVNGSSPRDLSAFRPRLFQAPRGR